MVINDTDARNGIFTTQTNAPSITNKTENGANNPQFFGRKMTTTNSRWMNKVAAVQPPDAHTHVHSLEDYLQHLHASHIHMPHIHAPHLHNLSTPSCGKKWEKHWMNWIEDTSFHGPKEIQRSKYMIQKILWVCLVIGLTVWTGYTTANMLLTYFRKDVTSDTVAISPSDAQIFSFLRIVYCPSDWLDHGKSVGLGLSDDAVEYLNSLLDVVTGKGIYKDLARELRNESVQQLYTEYNRMIQDFLEEHKKEYPRLRMLYEAMVHNFSSFVIRKQLCPDIEGNFCNYTFYPQKDMGFTVRKGRVCQKFNPLEDPNATHDPLQSATSVQFALLHRHKKPGRIFVSVRPYLGELLTTGLSDSTGLSFSDLFNFTSNDSYCKIKIAVSMYEINKINTSHVDDCLYQGDETRQPMNYPADTCKLLCVDKIFYQQPPRSCSLFYPLYRNLDNDQQLNTMPECSPVQIYQAMLDNLSGRDKQFSACAVKDRCETKIPCTEWFGNLEVISQDCVTGTTEANQTQIVLEMHPRNILVIQYRLKLDFAEMYSNIGGVMGLALGASIISMTHLLLYLIRSCRTCDKKAHFHHL